MPLSSKKKFYVYLYLRENLSNFGQINSPYYVGKGSNRRLLCSSRTIPVPTNDRFIHVISQNLNEPDAFQLEMLLIYLYGRIDLGTGCLRNRTDGGEGCSGLIHSIVSRKKMSESQMGHVGYWLGKSPSKEHRLKLSKANIGKTISNETRKKLSIANKNQIPWNKGKPRSAEVRRKISETKKSRAMFKKTEKPTV